MAEGKGEGEGGYICSGGEGGRWSRLRKKEGRRKKEEDEEA